MTSVKKRDGHLVQLRSHVAVPNRIKGTKKTLVNFNALISKRRADRIEIQQKILRIPFRSPEHKRCERGWSQRFHEKSLRAGRGGIEEQPLSKSGFREK